MALNPPCSACSRSRHWLSYSISFGSGSRIATLTMVFKPGMEAQKHWRRLNGPRNWSPKSLSALNSLKEKNKSNKSPNESFSEDQPFSNTQVLTISQSSNKDLTKPLSFAPIPKSLRVNLVSSTGYGWPVALSFPDDSKFLLRAEPSTPVGNL
jgi:hypothetical protein